MYSFSTCGNYDHGSTREQELHGEVFENWDAEETLDQGHWPSCLAVDEDGFSGLPMD